MMEHGTGEPDFKELLDEAVFENPDEEQQEEINRRERDFYQKLRERIRAWSQSEEGRSSKWTEYVMLAPDLFHLMCRLTLDRDVMIADKAKLVAAVAYFLSPFDIMPEVLLGPIGFADDVAIAAYVLSTMVNHTDPEVLRRNWAGEGEILELVQKVLGKAEEMIGAGTWQKLKTMFNRRVK